VPQERADRVLRVAAVVTLVEQQVEGLKDRHPAVLDVPEVVHLGRAAELAEPGRSVALDPEPVRMPDVTSDGAAAGTRQEVDSRARRADTPGQP
jgi:hypothetical protein